MRYWRGILARREAANQDVHLLSNYHYELASHMCAADNTGVQDRRSSVGQLVRLTRFCTLPRSGVVGRHMALEVDPSAISGSRDTFSMKTTTVHSQRNGMHHQAHNQTMSSSQPNPTMADAARLRLLHQLSQKPPPTCSSELVRFEALGLPVYEGHYAQLIHDAFTREECEALLQAAQAAHEWEGALINVGGGRQELATDVRLCDRIIWDDADVAACLLHRVLPHLPKEIVTLENCATITGGWAVRKKEVWAISRLNERLRFLKYTKGGYFRPHCDGVYMTPDKQEKTLVTVHIYLNGGDVTNETHAASQDDAKKPLRGGATRFWNYNEKEYLDVNPRAGSVLVFQHRNLLHSGDDVLQGTKYTLRSDILYHQVATGS